MDESIQDTAFKLKDLGNAAYKDKRFNEALAYYEVSILLVPNEMSFYNNIAGTVFKFS